VEGNFLQTPAVGQAAGAFGKTDWENAIIPRFEKPDLGHPAARHPSEELGF
jgi:hypothetical protein